MCVDDFHHLQTERLIIRKLVMSDKMGVFSYRSLPSVYQFQSFQPKALPDMDAFMAMIANVPNIPNTWFQMAVCLQVNHLLIGDIGVHFPDNQHLSEIGYTISPEHQGKGYAKEALVAVINYLFTVLKKDRITASVDPSNHPSIRLLDKIGFTLESHLKKSIYQGGMWLDDCVYSLPKDDFELKVKEDLS